MQRRFTRSTHSSRGVRLSLMLNAAFVLLSATPGCKSEADATVENRASTNNEGDGSANNATSDAAADAAGDANSGDRDTLELTLHKDNTGAITLDVDLQTSSYIPDAAVPENADAAVPENADATGTGAATSPTVDASTDVDVESAESTASSTGLDAAVSYTSSDPSGGDASTEDTCVVGEAASLADTDTVQLFGEIVYYAEGASLPAGQYRVTYVDGCMKYASNQDWAVHAYEDGSIAWYLGTLSGEKVVFLPGTFGIFEGSGGFSDFETCVAANLELPPLDFEFAGGTLGVWVADSNPGDNLPGVDGRNPKWRLDRLTACE